MNGNSETQKGFYKIYLVGFFLILALPIFTVSPWFFPAAWGKAIIFRIIISLLISVFLYQIIFQKGNYNKFRTIAKNLFSRKNEAFLPFWLLITLFGVFLLSNIFSLDTAFSFWGSPLRSGGFLNFGLYIIFAILAFFIIKKSDWKKIWIFNIFIGTAVSLIAVFQQFNVFNKVIIPYTDRTPSTMGGPTFLALYLILLFFLTLSFLLREKQGKNKLFYFLALLLFLYGIFITGSRAAYFGLGIGLLYFFLCYPKKLVRFKVVSLIILIMGIIVIYYVNTVPNLPYYLQKNKIFQALSSRLSINLLFEEPRPFAWLISLEAIKEKPLLGYGPENFSIAFDKYYQPFTFLSKDWGSWYDRAHNFLFDIAVTAGLPALIIYLSLLAVLFWKLQKVKEIKPEEHLIPHGIQAAFFGYLTTNLFGFDTFSTYLIFFLIVGYSLSLIARPKENQLEEKTDNPDFKEKKDLSPNKPIFFCILFFVLIYFIWVGALKPLSINKEINWADYYAQNNQCQKALDKMEKDVLYQESVIDSYAKLKYIELISECSKKNPKLKIDLATEAIDILKQTSQIRPTYTRTWLFLINYANLSIENKDYLKIKNISESKTLADSSFAKAKELSPNREQIYAMSIETNLLSGDFGRMEEKAEQGIKLNPGDPYYWWIKGLSDIASEEIELSEKEIKIAVVQGYDSTSKKSLYQLISAYNFLAKRAENPGPYYQKLINLYQELVIMEPDVYQHHASLAAIYKMIENYQKAKAEALIVIKMAPELKEEVEEFLKTLPY